MTMKRVWAGRVLSISAAAGLAGGGINPASAAPPDALVAAARQEGQLTTIALPHDWCGYGALIAAFQKKYGIHVNELNPRCRLGRRDRSNQGK
jgi:putative spermidine/putrescine transport system substrate-binding protein